MPSGSLWNRSVATHQKTDPERVHARIGNILIDSPFLFRFSARILTLQTRPNYKLGAGKPPPIHEGRPMPFAVTIHEKGGQPRRQEFDKTEVTIGRVQGNDIILPKQNVSKRHSRIVVKDGKFIIVDLKSTNGTYVNGRKIASPMVIKETDKIYIGDFILSAEPSASAAEAAAPPEISPKSPPPPPRRPAPAAQRPSAAPQQSPASAAPKPRTPRPAPAAAPAAARPQRPCKRQRQRPRPRQPTEFVRSKLRWRRYRQQPRVRLQVSQRST